MYNGLVVCVLLGITALTHAAERVALWPEGEMPNRHGFIPSDLDAIPDIEARGCRNGRCR